MQELQFAANYAHRQATEECYSYLSCEQVSYSMIYFHEGWPYCRLSKYLASFFFSILPRLWVHPIRGSKSGKGFSTSMRSSFSRFWLLPHYYFLLFSRCFLPEDSFWQGTALLPWEKVENIVIYLFRTIPHNLETDRYEDWSGWAYLFSWGRHCYFF